MTMTPPGGGQAPWSARDDDLAEWAAIVVDRLQAGQAVDIDAEIHRRPQDADELRRLFPALEKMARLMPRSGEGEAKAEADGVAQVPGGIGHDVVPSTPEAINSPLGDFRRVRVLGRGGMGIVYEAVQISLNRRVALKILPAVSADDPRRLRRFQVEAQAAACLHHPHIVPVYLVGSEGGVHYYAMQLIEGYTLAQVINDFKRLAEAPSDGGAPLPLPPTGTPAETVVARSSAPAAAGEDDTFTISTIDRPPDPPAFLKATGTGRRPSPRAAADLARQAAEALQFAHEQGILHRDVKPSNLLVNDSGWLWVADFGLARVPGDSDLTKSGDLVGTLRYMSPEQAMGERSVIDHRSDVYSLGVTLYELLTLRPAFETDDPLARLRRIAEEDPCPPRRIDSSIPKDLETIVIKAMAKAPGDRYATARDLADDLRRFLEHRPILAHPPSRLDRAAKWARRHRSTVTLTMAITLSALVTFGIAAFWRTRFIQDYNEQLQKALELADRHSVEANRQRALADRHEWSTRRLLYSSQLRLAQQELSAGRVEFAQEILENVRPKRGGRDPRGFEWYYLRRLSHREVSTLFGHEVAVRALALSPDGTTLASGDADGELIFWDPINWRLRSRVKAHPGEIRGLAFSPDGRALVSWTSQSGKLSEIKLWDAKNPGDPVRLSGPSGDVTGVTFSPDSRRLAVVDEGVSDDASTHRILSWDLGPGATQVASRASALPGRRFAFAPDGRTIATAGRDGPVFLRDLATGRELMTLPGPLALLDDLAFSPDGKVLAAGHGGGVTFWDPSAGQEVGSLSGPPADRLLFSSDGGALVAGSASGQELIRLSKGPKPRPSRVPLEGVSGKLACLAVSPDGKALAGAGDGLRPTLWDLSSGRTLATFPVATPAVDCLAFTPDGRSLVSGSEDARVRAWHYGPGHEPISQLSGSAGEVWALAYTPEGDTLASAGDDRVIRLWNPHDGTLRATLRGHESLVAALAISPDGKILASAGLDNTVRLWDLGPNTPRATLRGHSADVRALAFSPDGKTLASGGSDLSIRLWDATDGTYITSLVGHSARLRTLAFSPNGKNLVSSANDRTIRVWELRDRRQALALHCPNFDVSLAFSPDGTTLASGDERGIVSFWDVASWSRRASAKGSDAVVHSLAFTSDGQTLASASGDSKIRLWDPVTGQATLVLEGHAHRVNALAFSPDGRALASAGHDGIIKLWRAGNP